MPESRQPAEPGERQPLEPGRPEAAPPEAAPPGAPPPSWRHSLAGSVLWRFCVALILMAGIAAGAVALELPVWLTFTLCCGVGLPVGAWLLDRQMRPVTQVVQALNDGVSSLRDNDFSIRLAVTRGDELGELVRRYNEAVAVLRDERSAIRQRELLLETALYRSPVALVLTNQLDRVVYSNPEARRLFLGGEKIEGKRFQDILNGCPQELRNSLTDTGDSLFTIGDEREPETFHLSRRSFQLNRQGHTLFLLRRLTHEFSREEVRIWKRVIRVISHELNNSLAPISSLVHSAGVLAGRPDQQHRLPEIFASIEDRVTHLTHFLRGYARYARLPKPQKEATAWQELLDGIRQLYPFTLEGAPPEPVGRFDPAQIEQVLINLLKNAREASPQDAEIVVRLGSAPDGGTRVEVLDRGKGMDEETMRQALLPFFSTKKDGVGVGLPLCREILTEHGGKLSLRNREGGGLVATCWLPADPDESIQQM
ncbi:MAG: ATP-binding protein [Acidobacteriota bacterium]